VQDSLRDEETEGIDDDFIHREEISGIPANNPGCSKTLVFALCTCRNLSGSLAYDAP
jgi:hypothetical protein